MPAKTKKAVILWMTAFYRSSTYKASSRTKGDKANDANSYANSYSNSHAGSRKL